MPVSIDTLHTIKEYETQNSTTEQVNADIEKLNELTTKMTVFEQTTIKDQPQNTKKQLEHLSNILKEIPSPISTSAARTTSTSITSSLSGAIDQYGV